MSRSIELFAQSELAPGEMRAVDIEGIGRVAVYNVGGDWYATSDTCTHGSASLSEGILEGCTVICPFHSGVFDVRTGAAVGYPATVPVKAYPVTVKDGKVYLDTEPEVTPASGPRCLMSK